MALLLSYMKSSIGKKFLMGLTGLGLAGFVLGHMAGNMLLFVSAEAYNKYGHAIITNPAIYVIEAGLLAMVLVHIFCAVSLTLENKRAKGAYGYQASGSVAKRGNLASRTMIYTGTIILVFIISHLITFKYGTFYSVTYDGVEMRDLHRLMIEVFYEPMYVIWYVVSLILLGFHLKHGVASSFQSLGINHPRYNCFIKGASCLYTVIVTLGFLAQPLYIFFCLKNN